MDAQYQLAVMYALGQGVKQDYTKAELWWEKAAEQGHPRAQFLVCNYFYMPGAMQDYKKAFYWCQKAAEQGESPAQYALSALYTMGQGVTQDYKLAYIWAAIAAANGSTGAMNLRDSVAAELTPSALGEAQEEAGKMLKTIESNKK